MKREKFKSFWDGWSNEWIESSIDWNGEKVALSSLCALKSDYGDALYDVIALLKRLLKIRIFKIIQSV